MPPKGKSPSEDDGLEPVVDEGEDLDELDEDDLDEDDLDDDLEDDDEDDDDLIDLDDEYDDGDEEDRPHPNRFEE
jgi:hypothetical protein